MPKGQLHVEVRYIFDSILFSPCSSTLQTNETVQLKEKLFGLVMLDMMHDRTSNSFDKEYVIQFSVSAQWLLWGFTYSSPEKNVKIVAHHLKHITITFLNTRWTTHPKNNKTDRKVKDTKVWNDSKRWKIFWIDSFMTTSDGDHYQKDCFFIQAKHVTLKETHMRLCYGYLFITLYKTMGVYLVK